MRVMWLLVHVAISMYISAGPPLGGATRLRSSFYSQTVKQLPFLVLLSTYQSVVSLTVIFSNSC